MAIASRLGAYQPGPLVQTPDSELEDQWSSLLARFGVPAPLIARSFAEITIRYQAPGRHYHNLAHLRYALGGFQKIKSLARQPRLVQLAIWFHDLGFRPYGRANDSRSALAAMSWLGRFGIDDRAIDRVCRLIEVTRDHDPGELDRDAQIVSDADLAILGGTPEEYDWYRGGLRREYRLVPAWIYRRIRRASVARMLSRRSIYHTDGMRDQREERARANLLRELETLRFLR